MHFTVLYTLTNDDVLKIQFFATTDKPTPINLSQHAYYNLSGTGKGDVLNNVVKIYASKYLPVDAGLVPTGKIESVRGRRLISPRPRRWAGHQAAAGDSTRVRPLAGSWTPTRGSWPRPRKSTIRCRSEVECWTTEPAVNFSCARNIDNLPGKNGETYTPYRGFVLETQHFSIRRTRRIFRARFCGPGETYHQLTLFKFTVPEPSQNERRH